MLGIARACQAGDWQNNLPATPSTAAGGNGTLITASGTVHTKGSYAEIFSATTYDWYGFWIWHGDTSLSGSDTSMLMDIAIGAAGSETVIFPNFMAGYRGTLGGNITNPFFVPLYVPRGARLSARMQAKISADTCRVVIWGSPGWSGLPCQIFTNCDAYGIDSANSTGTSHTPGNATESTDADIGSTTSRPYGAVLLWETPYSTTGSSAAYHWELRIGSQTYGEWWSENDTSERVWGIYPPAPVTASIPTGTQLQVRAEASGATSACAVAFYCFY